MFLTTFHHALPLFNKSCKLDFYIFRFNQFSFCQTRPPSSKLKKILKNPLKFLDFFQKAKLIRKINNAGYQMFNLITRQIIVLFVGESRRSQNSLFFAYLIMQTFLYCSNVINKEIVSDELKCTSY